MKPHTGKLEPNDATQQEGESERLLLRLLRQLALWRATDFARAANHQGAERILHEVLQAGDFRRGLGSLGSRPRPAGTAGGSQGDLDTCAQVGSGRCRRSPE